MPSITKVKRKATIYEVIANSLPVSGTTTYTGNEVLIATSVTRYQEDSIGLYLKINRDSTEKGEYRDLLFTLVTVCVKCDSPSCVVVDHYSRNFHHIRVPNDVSYLTEDTLYFFCSDKCKSLFELLGE